LPHSVVAQPSTMPPRVPARVPPMSQPVAFPASIADILHTRPNEPNPSNNWSGTPPCVPLQNLYHKLRRVSRHGAATAAAGGVLAATLDVLDLHHPLVLLAGSLDHRFARVVAG